MNTHSQEDVYKLLELTNKYEEVLRGNKEKYGIINCIDSYYNNSFNDALDEIDNLRNNLNLT